jgi:hypothetical protein
LKYLLGRGKGMIVGERKKLSLFRAIAVFRVEDLILIVEGDV